MNLRFAILFSLLSISLYGKEVTTQGVVLVGPKTGLLSENELRTLSGVQVFDVEVPGIKKTDLVGQLEKIYRSRPLTMELVGELKKAIESFFEARACPFVSVVTPPQEVTDGVVQFLILPSQIGEVRVEGNKWTPTSRIARYTGAEAGEPVRVEQLEKGIEVLNRNPFRRVDLVYTPGKEEQTTDLIFLVQETKSAHVYAGTDNTGIETTGHERLYSGFALGNLFGLDQVLAFQYTASYDFKKFQAFTAQYTIPFAWGHLLNCYGGYSKLQASLPIQPMRNRGESSQASLRYTIPFKLRRNWKVVNEFSFGFDYKNTNNTLEFSLDDPIFAKSVNITQAAFDASFIRDVPKHRIDLLLSLFCSPAEILPNQSNSHFAAFAPHAKNTWLYCKGSFKYLYKFPYPFTLLLWGRFQKSFNPLIPIEQQGLGGYYTVRGYEENQVTTDNAFIGNCELRTPPYSFFSRKNKQLKDAFQLLAFMDYGWGQDEHDLPSPWQLWSAGLGARYTADPYISLRCDYGFQLLYNAAFDNHFGLVHFGATCNY